MRPTVPLAPVVSFTQGLLLTVLPHGGQHVARRNAWAGMAADASRARARREAEVALSLAGAVAATPAERRVLPGG